MRSRHTFRVGSRTAAADPGPETPRTLAALVASGVPLTTAYEMTQGSPADRYFTEQSLAAGFTEIDSAAWPVETDTLADGGNVVFRSGGSDAVYRFTGGTLARVSVGWGWCSVQVAAPDRDTIGTVFAAFRSLYPASYLTPPDDLATVVPITFWMLSPMGASARLRRIEAANWEDVADNYTAPVRAELDRIMEWENGPDVDGKLLLWYGPPGTGKTWALRVLASAWAPWAEFNFITDADAFFVRDASYMVDVLLADSYATIEPDSGDVYTEAKPDAKWRVLIFEDTGQLLAADASDTYRQGLGRFLNVVDGMIGQGLKVLAVVTTNDELGALHPAVTRPGRCASQIEFGPLTDDEAKDWTGDPDATSGTLAELYARGHRTAASALPAPVEDEPSPAPSLAASGPENTSERADVVDEVKRVAEDVNPLAVDYGQTAWLAEDATVLWVCGDGTSNDEIDEAAAKFLAIDGVDGFEYEKEAMPAGWCDAEVVYGGNPFDCDRAKSDAAIDAEVAAIVALASEPLDL